MGTAKAASNDEWVKWGIDDPLWAVASWPGRERDGVNPWTVDEFFELGREDWRDFGRQWKSYGMVESGTCIEIGSGAGRLTRFIADDFGSVIGVDVSSGMIEVARDLVPHDSIDWRLGDGLTLPVESRTAAGVFSSHVFQHFDSLQIAHDNLVEIARVLQPGGSLMIHMPLYRLPAGVPFAEVALRTRQTLAAVRARRARAQGRPLMRGLQYSVAWVSSQLEGLNLRDIEFRSFRTASNGAEHTFVLARR